MPDAQDIERRFWKALKSDMTLMLGLAGVEDGHTRPMTAQFEDERGPIWFFTSTEAELARQCNGTQRAVASFVSKDHDVFAAMHGSLRRDIDPAVIERLWSPFVAAWYEGGQSDPTLVLLRFDPAGAQIWLDGSSLLAGVKMLLGVDPKRDYEDKQATVRFE